MNRFDTHAPQFNRITLSYLRGMDAAYSMANKTVKRIMAQYHQGILATLRIAENRLRASINIMKIPPVCIHQVGCPNATGHTSNSDGHQPTKNATIAVNDRGTDKIRSVSLRTNCRIVLGNGTTTTAIRISEIAVSTQNTQGVSSDDRLDSCQDRSKSNALAKAIMAVLIIQFFSSSILVIAGSL